MTLDAHSLTDVLLMQQSVGCGSDGHRDDREAVSSYELIGARALGVHDKITGLTTGTIASYEDPETGEILYRIG